MTKQQRLNKIIKALTKLYPNMDRRKIRHQAYFYFSATWQGLRDSYPNTLITAL